MSNVPYYVPKVRAGLKMGHGKLIDGILGVKVGEFTQKDLSFVPILNSLLYNSKMI